MNNLIEIANSSDLNSLIQELDNGADMTVTNDYGLTPFFIIAKNGYIDMLKYLIEKRGVDANSRSFDMKTALHYASASGNIELVKYLIKFGLDINARDMDGELPFHIACISGNLNIVKMYMEEYEFTVFEKNYHDFIPIHWAGYSGHNDVVEYLLSKGSPISPRDHVGFTPLHRASRNGYAHTVIYLIEHGADKNEASDNGFTSLHWASRRGHIEVVKYLLKVGVDKNVKDKTGWTALHVAAASGCLEIAKMLIEYGFDRNLKTDEGETPIDLALRLRKDEVIIYLSQLDRIPQRPQKPNTC